MKGVGYVDGQMVAEAKRAARWSIGDPPTALVDPTAHLAGDVTVGPYVIIGRASAWESDARSPPTRCSSAT
jgi:carbonic anhydrase/acetyltransferase-like protein (isoleucine patch superfamily)